MTITDRLGRLPEPILIVGAYGYGNVGDEAILAGLLARVPERATTVVSRLPEETSRLHGVRAVGLPQAVVAMRRHRSVLIGGGGLFGRDMGRIGRLLPAFGLLAVALGKSVAVVGVDIDDRLSPSARLLVPPLLRRASPLSMRDAPSAAILARRGISAEVEADLSTWMWPARSDVGLAALERAGLRPDRPIVGLALTDVDAKLADRVVVAAAEAMATRPGIQFCFIPMSRHPGVARHDDRRLGQRLAAASSVPLAIMDVGDPRELLAALGHLSAVVAMRYHAMLLASRAGVPVVGIPYADKTRRWLEAQGHPSVPPTGLALGEAIDVAVRRDPGRAGLRLKVAS